MNRESLIERWVFECQPKNKTLMVEMLSTLEKSELQRYIFYAESKSGRSVEQISIKYAVGKDFVKYHIKKAKDLVSNCPH